MANNILTYGQKVSDADRIVLLEIKKRRKPQLFSSGKPVFILSIKNEILKPGCKSFEKKLNLHPEYFNYLEELSILSGVREFHLENDGRGTALTLSEIMFENSDYQALSWFYINETKSIMFHWKSLKGIKENKQHARQFIKLLH